MNDNNNNTSFTCSGDCLRCSVQQRIYCSSQMSRNAISMLDAILTSQKSILERFEAMERANRDEDNKIINPISGTPSEGLNEPYLDNAQ